MGHIPVLLHEVIDGLKPVLRPSATVFDGTAGAGGYSDAIAKEIEPDGKLIITDLDSAALDRAKAIVEKRDIELHLVKSNFREISSIMESLKIEALDAFTLDLGLSSHQLEDSGRGFSFSKDEPLLMTFESEPGEDLLIARDVVNEWSGDTLLEIIKGFGGESYSRARTISQAIVAARLEKPIETSLELASIIEEAVSRGKSKIHPATKTFQAIRIAVNDELGALEQVLIDGFAGLREGGRMAIVSFHEHEDRLVKRFNKAQGEKGATIVTKKPIAPSKKEVTENPRARSAKLRILEK